MRLASLARKIKVKLSELREFAGTHAIELPSGSNTKLSEVDLHLFYEEFAPELLSEEISYEKEPAEDTESLPIEEAKDMPFECHETEMTQEEIYPEKTDHEHLIRSEGPEHAIERPIELIRAPKIDLPGLTVRGKIELPEPGKKESESSKDKASSRETLNKNSRASKHQKDYNPIEAARKREEKKEKRIATQKAKKRKEEKRKRYQEIFQHEPKHKNSPKKVKTKVFETNVRKKAPGNGLKRAWNWLVNAD